MIRIEFLSSGAGRYWFRFKAWNGRILCHSELYTTKYQCRKAVDLITGDIMHSRYGVSYKW